MNTNKTSIQWAEGGVCFPKGFTAHALCAGIKKSSKKEDLALIVSEVPSRASGVFTKNLVQAEPVKLSRSYLEKEKKAQAIIVNSGNANACTGSEGAADAGAMTEATAKALASAGYTELSAEDVLIASTGVIGKQMPIEDILPKIPALVSGLSKEGNELARRAIMTTDLVHKEAALSVQIAGKEVRLGTMAKGSGMIHINMGTMLGFVTSDCNITSELLDEALKESVLDSYNAVSVDGDTSTNDTLFILANGLADNPCIDKKNEDYYVFLDALKAINIEMAKAIASDGEGATHMLECELRGASDKESARNLAKSVISSSLVKAAFFGRDANWGRILCALGYSGSLFSPEKVSLSFASEAGELLVFEKGRPLDFDEDKAKTILSEKNIRILVDLEDGEASAKAWGCDLSYDYVKINGDYRT
jgi:glutamate N-acetyltransferase/amino-acid N-acetyltransferase